LKERRENMKTHTLARGLEQLATLLKQRPDTDVREALLGGDQGISRQQDVPLGLSVLVRMSKIGKPEWISFIKSHGFPIDVGPRDSSRNILGRVLNYLERNPNAQMQLQMRSEAKGSSSPALAKALRALMDDSG
jgi:hypothetical protein